MTKPNKVFETVGELVAALQQLPADMEIAKRGSGGEWLKGVEAGKLELIVLGEGKDRGAYPTQTLEKGQLFENWKGAKGRVFIALAID